MKSKIIHKDSGQRIFAVVMDREDEAMQCISDFAAQYRLNTGLYRKYDPQSGLALINIEE